MKKEPEFGSLHRQVVIFAILISPAWLGSLVGCASPAEAQQSKATAIVKVAEAEVEAVQQQSELPDDLERPEAAPEPTPAKASELHKARVDQLTEQVDAYGLATAEVESSLNEKFKKLSERLTEMEQRLGQIEQEQAKTWLLLHTPPMVKGEADPVKEFMEAKRPEVFGFLPWFTCPHCTTHRAYWETAKGVPFDVIWGEIEDEAEMKAMGVPAGATFPLYKMPTKKGDWFIWAKTPEGLISEFKARNQ